MFQNDVSGSSSKRYSHATVLFVQRQLIAKASFRLVTVILQWTIAMQRQEISYLFAEMEQSIAGRSSFAACC